MKNISGMVPLLFSLVFATPMLAQRYTVFPQFASGSGWSSQLFFTNQGISQVSGITINFCAQNGEPLFVESNLGSDSSFTFDLNAGATQVIGINPPDLLVVGYVVVRYPAYGDPVTATEVFRYEQNGTVFAEVGVPQQEIGDHFSFPVEITKDREISTGIALVNTSKFTTVGPMAETLLLNLIRPDGSIYETVSVPMSEGQHRAAYVDADWLFPHLEDFYGSLSVSGPVGVGVVALRQDRQANGGIATNGGPILGPFALKPPVVLYEAEPNDYIEEAMPLTATTIIEGSVGTNEDYDYFAFSGKSGDIVSVICETPDPDSYLDSVLAIYDADLQLVAYNDQNGLSHGFYAQNDSFIQLKLPEDGIYYIELTDYYGYGEPTDTYRLHVKLK